jgi:hypothetical protein
MTQILKTRKSLFIIFHILELEFIASDFGRVRCSRNFFVGIDLVIVIAAFDEDSRRIIELCDSSSATAKTTAKCALPVTVERNDLSQMS